jgi:hypothetical protein
MEESTNGETDAAPQAAVRSKSQRKRARDEEATAAAIGSDSFSSFLASAEKNPTFDIVVTFDGAARGNGKVRTEASFFFV